MAWGVFPLAVPSGPPFATIEASSNTVRGGDIFNVTCTVLGEPEMNVSFSWRYPGLVSVTFVIFPHLSFGFRLIETIILLCINHSIMPFCGRYTFAHDNFKEIHHQAKVEIIRF